MIKFDLFTLHIMQDGQLRFYEGYMQAILDRGAEVERDGTDVQDNLKAIRAEKKKRGMSYLDGGWREGWQIDAPEIGAMP